MTAGKSAKKDGAAAGSPAVAGPGGSEGAEVAEERVEVVTYAAAIDVAKGSGMVCTRVPGSRPDRKRQAVWQVDAACAAVVALMDLLRCQGIQRLVLESTSDYWRIWYYLAEAAGLEVWLVNAREAKHLPGRGKSDREDCVWLCKLNERGMLRRSFVPPEGIRDLRSLARTRSRLAQDQVRHQNRVEKILGDALLKISVVISDLFGTSGRRFPDALVAGERSPAALAALGDRRLKAARQQLAAALTGRFREVHAFEIATHLRLIDTINEEITRLDARIEQQLASIPGVAPACAGCGLAGGGHSPGCASDGTPVPGLVARLDEITGAGVCNGPYRQGKPLPARRARPVRDGGGQDRYPPRRAVPADSQAPRQAESHRRGLPRHLRDRLHPHQRSRRPVHRPRRRLLQPRGFPAPDPFQDPGTRAAQPRHESHPHPGSASSLNHVAERNQPTTRHPPELSLALTVSP